MIAKNKNFLKINVQKALDSFHLFLYRSFKFSIKHPLLVLILGLALPASLSFKLTQLPKLYDTDDLVDQNFKSFQSLKSIERDFKDKNNLQLIFSKETSFTEKDLCFIKKMHSKIAVFSGYVINAHSIFELRYTKEEGKKLQFPRIFDLSCDSASDSLVSARLDKNPWKGLVYNSPLNSLISEYQIRNTAEEKWERPLDPTIVGNIYDRIQKMTTEYDQDITIYPAGNTLFQWYMLQGYKEIERLNVIVVLGLLILFWFFWRTFKSTLIFVFSLAYTMWLTHIFMSIMNYPIDILSSTIFLILTLSTIEDFIYLSSWQLKYPNNWKRPFQRMLIPSFYTSLTTIIGFASLMTADLEIIERFGMITAFSAFVEWITLFILFPAVLTLSPKLRNWTKKNFSMNKIGNFIASFQTPFPKVGLSLLVFFPIAFWSAPSRYIEDTPLGLFKKSHPLNQTRSHLIETRNWTMPVSLIFNDFDETNQNKKIIQEISRLEKVKFIEDPYTILDFFTSPSLNNLGLIQDQIKSSKGFSRYYNYDNTKARALMYTNTESIKDTSKFTHDINEICGKSCEPAGSLISYAEFGSRIPKSLLTSLSTCCALISLILLLLCYYKSVPFLLTLLSALWGPAFIISFLWIFDIQIYFATSIFASVLVGLAGDNAVQFIFSSSKKDLDKGLKKLQIAAFLVGISLIVIPLSFLLAPFPPLQSLGLLFAFGLLASLFGDTWVLNSLLQFKKKYLS